MDTLNLNGIDYKLVKVDKPHFILKSEVEPIMAAANATLKGEVPFASASMPILRDSLKFGNDFYAYFPIKNEESSK